MSNFCNDNRFGAIQQVAAYWEALRDGRLMPERSEIDPRGLENALENTFILERIAPGIARMRIAGSHLSKLMGMEVRGMPLLCLFTPAARVELNECLADLFEKPAKLDLMLTAERGIGKPALEARLVLLPLTSDDGKISRVLGCLMAKGQIGRQPRLFEIVQKSIQRLNADPGPYPEPEPRLPVAGFAEPEVAIDCRQKIRSAPHLRLVKND